MSLKYRVIERLRDTYSISEMCKLFEVSRSSYYVWRKKQQCGDRDREIANKITESWNSSKQTYGCYRMWKYFRERLQIQINIKKIRRIMRKYGISAISVASTAHARGNNRTGRIHSEIVSHTAV